MKALICMTVIALSSTAMAEETAPTQPASVDKVLERVDVAGQWVSTTLEKLADKLGTTVSYLWPTYVRQVMAEGARTAGMGLFLILLGVFIYFKFQNNAKKIRSEDRNSRGDEDDAQAYVGFSYGLLFVLLIIGAYVLSCGVVDLVAPEPTALKNIVEAVKVMR